MNKPIRVLVVDDSPFMRTALTRMLQTESGLEVVGTAADGIEAIEKTETLDPDVITLDIEMPRMDGLTALKRIMTALPRPVLVVSTLTQRDARATIEALELGAFDCMAKMGTRGSMSILQIRDELVTKVKAAAQAKPRIKKTPLTAVSYHAEIPPTPAGASPSSRVVAIGASTGGPKVLQQVLTPLPADFPVPIVVVQHMPLGFTGPFAERLDSICQIRVKEAAEGDLLENGHALIAPAGLHLSLERSGAEVRVHLSREPQGYLHRPSVDVMQLSIAKVFGNEAMGVILTGMGDDGQRGMQAIAAAGGWTVGQSEETCAVYGMPRACAESGALRRELPPAQISGEMIRQTRLKTAIAR